MFDVPTPSLRVTRIIEETKNSRVLWVEQSAGYQRVTHNHNVYIVPMPWLYFQLQIYLQDYSDEKKFLPARLREKEMYETSISGSVNYAYSSPCQLVDGDIRPDMWPMPVPNVSEGGQPCGAPYHNGTDEVPEEIDNLVLANLVLTEYWDQSFNTDYFPRHWAWKMMGWRAQPWWKRWMSLEGSRMPGVVFPSWEKNYTLDDVLQRWPWERANRVRVTGNRNPVYGPEHYGDDEPAETPGPMQMWHTATITTETIGPRPPDQVYRDLEEQLNALLNQLRENDYGVTEEWLEDYDEWQEEADQY